jgi:hypothetical protein
LAAGEILKYIFCAQGRTIYAAYSNILPMAANIGAVPDERFLSWRAFAAFSGQRTGAILKIKKMITPKPVRAKSRRICTAPQRALKVRPENANQSESSLRGTGRRA